ncbi:glycoside hydrolase family 88 protein [Caulobacter sp. RL271]|jgi:unsaturated chondroitin disaccharide hydrolase|uniref:Glycoside hydrolase family 88 protein n=1 Tax=Caulobacter segnis TaxID=88688 RepID=A0ABY4ZXI7_9CAUL|nr:glycoside hydrolase family 88 protein [Caulobacter segnis]USQ97415.1 glycoside hydrolase family 88 protein [Caulobacter segnis]
MSASLREPIARAPEILRSPRLDRARLDAILAAVLARIDDNLAVFTDAFPAPSSEGGVYPAIDNIEWTNGFWTGMLWLAFEASGEARYRAAAERQVRSFKHRIDHRINVDHHDLGFLYSLSCVAAWKVTGDACARDAAIQAADALLDRFLPTAGIIQAWGDLSNPAEAGRMIIDCNLNLPLLYWAAEVTGDREYAKAANRHIDQAARHIVRPDASTFHTFFMDPATGAPLRGTTHQGFSDSSCWARGQAWGVSGFPLVHRYNADPALIDTAARLANYFLNRLPDDLICCWDLVFTDDSQPRDSSAAAIAACGLLELARALPLGDPDRATYEAAALAMVETLGQHYLLPEGPPGTGVLAHAVYHMPKGVGVDEACLWGDYFFLEALVRLTRVWEPYW